MKSSKLRALITDREETASHAAGQSLAVPANTQDRKPLTFFNEIKSDPKQWENVCLAKYFNLKDLRAR